MATTAKQLTLYDTTLRDGTQMEGISLSVEDKLKITRMLDKLGVDFIEGRLARIKPQGRRILRKSPGLGTPKFHYRRLRGNAPGQH